MAEFKRSRLERKSDDQITRKTVFLGMFTVLLFVLVVFFGLPFLIKFSVFLGRSKSKNENIKEVVLPPLAPRLIVPFEATNSSKINISGLAEAGVSVELLKNDVSIGKADVSGNGDFMFSDIELNGGDNSFNAIVLSEKSGNSEKSKTVNVVFDDQAPDLVMTNPTEDSISVDYADFDVAGKSEKGVRVLVNGHVAMVSDEGSFKLKIQLNSGDNDIEIKVSDLAGNETKKNIKIKYDI